MKWASGTELEIKKGTMRACLLPVSWIFFIRVVKATSNIPEHGMKVNNISTLLMSFTFERIRQCLQKTNSFIFGVKSLRKSSISLKHTGNICFSIYKRKLKYRHAIKITIWFEALIKIWNSTLHNYLSWIIVVANLQVC